MSFNRAITISIGNPGNGAASCGKWACTYDKGNENHIGLRKLAVLKCGWSSGLCEECLPAISKKVYRDCRADNYGRQEIIIPDYLTDEVKEAVVMFLRITFKNCEEPITWRI